MRAHVPAPAGIEGKTHHVRTDGRAHTPHTVQPAHVTACKVQGHIIIQCGIHAAGSEAVGYGPENQLPVSVTDGKTEQCHGGRCNAESRDPACTELAGQTVAHEAGNHRANGDNHRNCTGIGYRHAEFQMHRRPA